MWGWKTVEREIQPAISVEEARQRLTDVGFEEQSQGESHGLFRRDGTQFTRDGRNVSLEVAVVEESDRLVLQIRYDQFVLFDTGDLERYADEVAASLQPAGA